MAELVLQDEISPMLAARGFERSGKVFRGRSEGGLGFTVWLNPENRLRRVRTISVDCWLGVSETDEWLYTFDQARAVSEIERGAPWASFEYAPNVKGWPYVIVEDFVRTTLPFIDACESPAKLCELLLGGLVPPSNMKQPPLGWIQDVWHVAEKAHLLGFRDEALSRLAELPLSVSDQAAAQWWAESVGLGRLVLRPPVEEPRRWLEWIRRRRNASN